MTTEHRRIATPILGGQLSLDIEDSTGLSSLRQILHRRIAGEYADAAVEKAGCEDDGRKRG